jgi:hypothetical protein
MGDEITNDMLDALSKDSSDTQSTYIESQKVTLDAITTLLVHNIDRLSIEDRKIIGNILVVHDQRNLICACAEGSVVNLNKVPRIILEKMYIVMKYKLANQV